MGHPPLFWNMVKRAKLANFSCYDHSLFLTNVFPAEVRFNCKL